MAVDGKWNMTIKTPMGDQTGELTLKQDGNDLNGNMSGAMGAVDIENGKVEGDSLTWTANVTAPMPVQLDFTGKVDDSGDISGDVKLGAFGSSTFHGTPA